VATFPSFFRSAFSRRSCFRLITGMLAGSAAAIALAAAPSFAQSGRGTIGEAASIKNIVRGSRGERRLAVSDPVYPSERISAAADSHGEIRLSDDSKVIVGENSEIELDDFVVADGDIRSATLSVTRGAFRFISGTSAKGTFKVNTPLSTIGVRGTVFDVYVSEGGVTNVVLLSGAVRVCTLLGNCRLAERACDVVEVRGPNEIEEKPFLRSARRNATEEREAFALLHGQNRFERKWRAATIPCNQRAAIEAQENRGIRTPGSGAPDATPEPQVAPDPYAGGCSGPYC
jgi:hypothetical protein